MKSKQHRNVTYKTNLYCRSRLRPYTDNLERGQNFTKICMYNVIFNYFIFGKSNEKYI